MHPSADADRTAVDRAYQARRAGTRLGQLEGLDRDHGLRLQLEVARRFTSDDDDPIAGWKVGMTSGNARDAMGEGFRPFGYVLRSRTFDTGSRIDFGSEVPGAIEPEISLVLGAPLRGEVTPAEAAAAVRGVLPSFELLEQRVDATGDATAGTRLIDGLSNWGMVRGQEVPVDALSEVAAVELYRDDELVGAAVEGDGLVLDDLFLSLSRLAALLDSFGVGLEPGQTVLTGALAKTPATAPSRWRAEFSGIGEVTVQLD